MPITTPAEIIAVKAPQYAGDPRETDMIALAGFHVSQEVFGPKYNYALALVVCHWYAVEELNGGNPGSGGGTGSGSGAGGMVKSEKEGDLARTKGNINPNAYSRDADQDWAKTSYGQEFISLRNACIVTLSNRCVGNVPTL